MKVVAVATTMNTRKDMSAAVVDSTTSMRMDTSAIADMTMKKVMSVAVVMIMSTRMDTAAAEDIITNSLHSL